MKKILFIVVLFALCSCVNLGQQDPYTLCALELKLSFPQGSAQTGTSGIAITVTDSNTGASYKTRTGADGSVSLSLPKGLYRVVSETIFRDGAPYNVSLSGLCLDSQSRQVSLNLKRGRIGDICIKEIYCGGCMKLPEEGSYNIDSYVILHNNSASVQYLDGLCFGTADPYNSTSTTVWSDDVEFVPVIQAVWQFPGSGKDFPLRSGEDAVLVVYGAIDHAARYPLSVNLNKPDYFVCYNATYFPNTSYHPTPGDRIQSSRIMGIVTKLGKANAYTFSNSSPAVVLFRSQGMSMEEFIAKEGSVIQKPGSSDDKIVCVPEDWIEDGVEVFSGQSAVGSKRLHAIVDSGYATLSVTHSGYTIMRKTDESKSLQMGYEVLADTNNSLSDFVERKTQSLRDE